MRIGRNRTEHCFGQGDFSLARLHHRGVEGQVMVKWRQNRGALQSVAGVFGRCHTLLKEAAVIIDQRQGMIVLNGIEFRKSTNGSFESRRLLLLFGVLRQTVQR